MASLVPMMNMFVMLFHDGVPGPNKFDCWIAQGSGAKQLAPWFILRRGEVGLCRAQESLR